MTVGLTRANLTTAWAPAKVNLYLHVGAPGAGGLHPLDSLVLFSDTRAADRISARAFPQLTLSVEGPNAKALKNTPNNLTLAAAMALERLANQLGSDVPACVRGRPLLMRGAGERLIDVAAPDIPIVLVNPGIPLETRKVFDRFDQIGANRTFRESDPPNARDLHPFVTQLAGYRNDLEPAAIALCPEIGKAIAGIKTEKGCMLARMSGSGPTCFGIFESEVAAETAARHIAARKRKYWVRATTLRGALYAGAA